MREGVDVVDHGEFWFSETPEVVASKSWDSSLPRMCVWVDVRWGGELVRVYGTHYDHRGEEARRRASEMIRDHAAASARVVAMGDFNAREEDEPMVVLLEAGYRSAVMEVNTSVEYCESDLVSDPAAEEGAPASS